MIYELIFCITTLGYHNINYHSATVEPTSINGNTVVALFDSLCYSTQRGGKLTPRLNIIHLISDQLWAQNIYGVQHIYIINL